MQNLIKINLLKPHTKNQEYFENVSGEKYQEIKQSIQANGIRDPLKVLPDYTVIAGHQRLRIAEELGIEKVPVVVLDISEEEAEYLLIADNEERRQGDNDNPMMKAKRIKFLKEFWGIRRGGNKLTNLTIPLSSSKGTLYPLLLEENGKTLNDLASEDGMSVEAVKKLLKLNNLIPPLQKLVSEKNLTASAAYSLAFLTEEEQEHTLATFGEAGVCGLSVSKAKEIRLELESQRNKIEGAKKQIVALSSEVKRLSQSLQETQEEANREATTRFEQKILSLKSQIEELEAKQKTNTEPDSELLEQIEHLTMLHEEVSSAMKEKEELLKTKSERYKELQERHKKANEKLKKAEADAEKRRVALENFKDANRELSGQPVYKVTRIRSLIYDASRVIGEYTAPISIEFKENLIGNEDTFPEIAERIDGLANQLLMESDRLKSLIQGCVGGITDINGKIVVDTEIIDV